MGLDVTAYSQLVPATEQCDFSLDDDDNDAWEQCFERGHIRPYLNEHFPHAHVGLEVQCYVKTASSEELDIHHSYGGYSAFRDTIAELMTGVRPPDKISEARATWWREVDRYRDYPFFELVCFSDCEGAISADTAGKLYLDFTKYRDQYLRGVDEYHAEFYDRWTSAFDLARRGGFVTFL